MATSKSTATEVNVASLAQYDSARSKLLKKFQVETKQTVVVSPFYAPHLGKTVMVSIQGITVWVKANGQPHRINKSHAAALYEAIRDVDIRVKKQLAMSDVQKNRESSIGELRF